jgi:hypothetical protein
MNLESGTNSGELNAPREMKNVSREVLPSVILSLASQRDRCRTTWLQDYRVLKYRLLLPPLLNVMYCVRVSLREGLSLRNTKEKGIVGNLYISQITDSGKNIGRGKFQFVKQMGLVKIKKSTS